MLTLCQTLRTLPQTVKIVAAFKYANCIVVENKIVTRIITSHAFCNCSTEKVDLCENSIKLVYLVRSTSVQRRISFYR